MAVEGKLVEGEGLKEGCKLFLWPMIQHYPVQMRTDSLIFALLLLLWENASMNVTIFYCEKLI